MHFTRSNHETAQANRSRPDQSNHPSAISLINAASALVRSRLRHSLPASLADRRAARPRRRTQSNGDQAVVLRAQGQGGHPSVHGRGAKPARSVRLQAQLVAYEGKPIPPESSAASDTPSSAPMRRCWGRGSSSPNTARAARRSPKFCRTWPNIVDDICIIKSRQDGSVQPRAGADLFQHRLLPAGPAEHGLVGDLRPRLRSEQSARLRRHVHRRGHQRRMRPIGRADSCRPSTPACASATRAIRFSTSPAPPESIRAAARFARSHRITESTTAWRPSRRSRKSPRASPPMRWLIDFRPPPPN